MSCKKKRYTFILPDERVKMPDRALLPAICHSDGDVPVICLVDLSDPNVPKVINSMPMKEAVEMLRLIMEPSISGTVQ